MENTVFERICIKEVVKYVNERLDKSDGEQITEDNVFVVWSCKALQNNKALLSTTLSDGMYYELAYNGDKEELYLDAYKKWENVCIKVTTEILGEALPLPPFTGTQYGTYETIEGEVTEEALSVAKAKVVENVCEAIRCIAEERDDFFMVRKVDEITSVANKFVLPTVKKEAPACRLEVIDERK